MSGMFLARVHANAVGAGVGLAIHVIQRQQRPETPEAWVAFCVAAAQEASEAVFFDPPERPPDRSGPAARFIEKLEQMKTGQASPPELMSGDELAEAAHNAAAAAFRICMPLITSRKQTQGYIACVAAGVQRRYIDSKDAKPMLYTAQLALSAHPQRRATTRRK